MTKLIIKNATTPTTPESGKTAIYVDSTTKKLVSKDDTGTETLYDAGGGGAHSDLTGIGTNTHDEIDTYIALKTTKGDLTTYSTAPTRLGVGTNDQVLTADSAEATGLKWATPSAGGTENITVTTADTTSVNMLIQEIASQTANVMETKNSAGTVKFNIQPAGNVGIVSGGYIQGASASFNILVHPYIRFAGSGGSAYVELGANLKSMRFNGTDGLKIFHIGCTNVDGSVSTPAFRFTSDPDSGMYYNSGVCISFGGVEKIKADASGTEINTQLSVGTAAGTEASAIIDATSTTQGFLPPRMTTTQRDAIGTPAAGLMIFNSTTNKLNFYSGSAWEAVTSA